MKYARIRVCLAGVAAVGLLLQMANFAQIARAAESGTTASSYHLEENWAKLPPGRIWTGLAGVDIDPDGKSVWVLDRCVEVGECATSHPSPIQKFDSEGRRVAGFGDGMFVSPHGFFVDRRGNIWVTDAQGQTVTKFSPDGRLLMTLGERGVAGDDSHHFHAPSDVVVSPKGDIFVADGHGAKTNARIVKFSKDGKFITAWGKAGSAPGEFDTPHSITMDSAGRIYVADRGNRRIQIFDQNGKFITAWDQFGDPMGISIDRKDIIYVMGGAPGGDGGKDDIRGIRYGSVKDGKVAGFIPDGSDGTESVAADRAGHIYGGTTKSKTLKRFVRD